jgi:hypothetical protein
MSKTLRRGTVLTIVSLVLVLALPAVGGATPTPAFSTRWGSTGAGPGSFDVIHHVAADRMGRVYVADDANNRVQRFSTAGVFDISWNSNGTTTMSGPSGIAVDRAGRIYVTEGGGQRVDKYEVNGDHLLSIGLGAGGDPGHFGTPSAIAVDAWGFIYVTDEGGLSRVQKFAPDGSYVMTFGTTGSGTLLRPSGIAIDPLGNIYVADTGNNRVVEFGSTGMAIRSFGTLGSGPGQLNTPRGIAFSADGNVLVADQFNGRVNAYSPTGVFQYSFGQGGASGQNIAGALGVATDATGIYVSDIGDNSVKKYTFGAPKPVTRISGANRYALAANVAAARWPRYRGMRHVVIVNGENSAAANALAVSPLAGVYNAPVLLTKKSALSRETNTALKQMRAASGPLVVHVVGDTKLISKKTYLKIKADNRGGSVERINGHDPYTLSLRIARRVKAVTDAAGTSSDQVMVFNAERPGAYWDALMAGPAAARSGIPMLAVRANSVPAAIRGALLTTFASREKWAVNSSAYLSDSMYARIGAAHRLSVHGERSASAKDIALFSRDGSFTSWDSVGAVSTIPAAIVAGPYMGLQSGVTLYTRKSVWPSANTAFFGFTRPSASVLRGFVIGSTNDVSNATRWRFSADLNRL